MTAYDDVEYQMHSIRAALYGFAPLTYEKFARIVAMTRQLAKSC